MKNSEFITDGVPITKEEVRAISISKLNLNNARSFLDIGSGTGTITVEVALNNPNVEVFSIEKNESAYELTRKNIEKFGLKNVTQLFGVAPMKIEPDKKFDAIFVGGTGEELIDVLEWSYNNMKNGSRFVANFILIDNFFKCNLAMERIGFKNIEVIQVGVSKLEALGSGKYFKPLNPVFVVSAEK
ncbi:MAG: decarboxylating cobalt-precorrin-6B (C(15))-methyltransferase [Peptostreptococcus porci]|uniref:decarboxylating cobalt-precorrin-6B (C(15))-methyltransferase n=1 Tax=Peptostreptococcus porci TaxID=2652282 RepID=UPI0023F4D469|nr:decarboxylating cobalt-precorrin-6B (C(15))-methyltransferase [Peptostreptococcus porci]MDD7183639.1 decarboxylating cobalt-precorrin-6B (C(15))-methyltransferase [Peptostreptococcus porci]MDY4560642.1 decarboxylating cobalt-precorrin-6B (C(15))-methyltransferase [Peptostreptococcus porci]MDY5479180.1 decarboxylating cobalt-precorrin-6B (C(15))-methyltransferase [Peptostreptococcus porci]